MESSDRITKVSKSHRSFDDGEFGNGITNKKNKASKLRRVSGKFYYQKRFRDEAL